MPKKISNPGLKNVLRVYDKKTGKMKADIIILEGESIDESKDLLLKSDKAPWRFRTIPAGTYRVQQMLILFLNRVNWYIKNRISRIS